jgi:copper chaperone CopZ
MLEDAGFDISDPDDSPSRETFSSPTTVVGAILSDRHLKHMQQCLSCHEAGTLGDDAPSLLRGNVGSPSFNSICPADHSTLEGSAKDTNVPCIGPSYEVPVDDVPLLVTLSVGGMTCSSCSGTITEMVSQLTGISKVVVNLLNNSATVVVERRDLVGSVTETIEDCGFEADVIKVEPLVLPTSSSNTTTTGPRNLLIRVDGMYCQYVDPLLVACILLISVHQTLPSKDHDCFAKAPTRSHHHQTIIRLYGSHNGGFLRTIASGLYHPLHYLRYRVRGTDVIQCIDLSSAYARTTRAQHAAA